MSVAGIAGTLVFVVPPGVLLDLCRSRGALSQITCLSDIHWAWVWSSWWQLYRILDWYGILTSVIQARWATSIDKLKSYGAAKREILPGVEHRQSRYLNNRCENSHRPTRQREYRMQGLKSAGHAQRFLSAYGPITQHFRPRRHLLSASEYRQEMRQRFESWAAITGTEWAA